MKKLKKIYLTESSFYFIPFDKSEERIFPYISVELLKEWINENIHHQGKSGVSIIKPDELLKFIEEDEK